MSEEPSAGAPRPRRAATTSDSKPAVKTTKKAAQKRRPRRKQTPEQVARATARRLMKGRPGLVDYVLDGLGGRYGTPTWEARLDPVSELILTILTQNTADVNAEKAFEALREHFPSPDNVPMIHMRKERAADGTSVPQGMPDGWGGEGIPPGRPPDWRAVEDAPIDDLIDVIRNGGLAYQKAPRIQAALRTIREHRGDYDLSFLAEMPPLDARTWLTQIPGIGKKTASIVLLFCFGLPLFPIDTHVERVSKRIGLLPAKAPLDLAHEIFLSEFAADDMYRAHVLLITHGREICHAQRPRHEICPIADRCRFFQPKAP
jgi:endonuclease-3